MTDFEKARDEAAPKVRKSREFPQVLANSSSKRHGFILGAQWSNDYWKVKAKDIIEALERWLKHPEIIHKYYGAEVVNADFEDEVKLTRDVLKEFRGEE